MCLFSSRRRHTRFDCDWSSDVCSSDLTWLPPDCTTRCRPGRIWRAVDWRLITGPPPRPRPAARAQRITPDSCPAGYGRPGYSPAPPATARIPCAGGPSAPRAPAYGSEGRNPRGAAVLGSCGLPMQHDVDREHHPADRLLGWFAATESDVHGIDRVPIVLRKARPQGEGLRLGRKSAHHAVLRIAHAAFLRPWPFMARRA